MPKMKTHRGMAKRIKVTGTGRLKRGTYVKKAVKLKRRRGRQLDVDPTNASTVRKWLVDALGPVTHAQTFGTLAVLLR